MTDVVRIERAFRAFQPDVIYDRYNSYSTAALRVSRRHDCPLVVEVNAPVVFERTHYEYMRMSFPRLAEAAERSIVLGADHVVTVSTALKEYLIKERGGVAERISVIPNAINPCSFAGDETGQAIREKYGLEQRTIVGFVGSLRAWHGVNLLMEIIPEVIRREPACHFLIVGSGELEAKFRQFVVARELAARVTMTGWVRHSDVASHVAAMDVAIMPDSNFYGSPIKIFEYMALGKAVVAPALGPLQEVITNGVDGVLVEPGKQQALVEAIVSLARDAATRKRMGKRARDVVFANHTWRHNARRIEHILQCLISGGEASRAY